MTRRTFIQNAALTAAGASLATSSAWATVGSKYKNKIGLQLYTLRDIIKQDPKAVMKMVADLGYNEVETYDYEDGDLFGMKAKDFGNYAKSLGIKVRSGHYKTGQITPDKKGTLINDWERAVSDAKEIGQDYMIIGWLEPAERKTMDDYKKVIELVNKGAEVCQKYGVRIGYHNHEFEFTKIDGQVPYDLMLQQFDKNLISMELDLYWVHYSNLNPLDYFEKYPGRFEQWHVKDMDKTDRKRNADIGTGTIDFKAIFANAKKSGMKHFYIEQETYPVSSSESIKVSIKNFRGMM